MAAPDAIVVGSGPNGLAAAVRLARAGLSVRVREGADRPGGGARTGELTLPGFRHDVCSAVHPLALSSPFLRELGLGAEGLEWVHPDAPLAHPLDDGPAVLLERDPRTTGEGLDRGDGDGWRELFAPFADRWTELAGELLAPLHVPRHPLLLARFGLRGLRSARSLAAERFHGPRGRALFAGIAAHATVPLERAGTAGFGLVLGAAGHAVGWPFPRGGAGAVADALVARLRSLGGEVVCDAPVDALEEVEGARLVLLDVTPAQLLRLAGHRLPPGYRARLRGYRYGPGAFKVDWALSEPIPWSDPACARAGTVHLGGSLPSIARAERAPWEGRHAGRPFVLLAQPSLFDDSRAPPGKHTAWAYCHVPHASDEDVTRRIEAQVGRFAPGFRETILARSVLSPGELEARNPNLVGGDINGGVQDLPQLLFRPLPGLRPYATPLRGVFLCSSSTPPGGGVHGMCGYHAAGAALGVLGLPRGSSPGSFPGTYGTNEA